MFGRPKFLLATMMFAALTFGNALPLAYAQDASWRVAKSSGDVWVTTAGSQHASLGADTVVAPGGTIRTGRSGRVLLIRGAERILVSPNTEIGIPLEKKGGDLATTIMQRTGTILLDVEKRNVQHFEVETPYLATVVKGTQFRVSVEKGTSRVEVFRGQVQVSDFKSGENVLVLPGQMARTSGKAAGGLILTGQGRLNAIEPGPPRASSVRPLAVPATAAAARNGGTGRSPARNAPSGRGSSRADGRGNHPHSQGRAAHRSTPGRSATGFPESDEGSGSRHGRKFRTGFERKKWLRSGRGGFADEVQRHESKRNLCSRG
jgi:hypothetical protein